LDSDELVVCYEEKKAMRGVLKLMELYTAVGGLGTGAIGQVGIIVAGETLAASTLATGFTATATAIATGTGVAATAMAAMPVAMTIAAIGAGLLATGVGAGYVTDKFMKPLNPIESGVQIRAIDVADLKREEASWYYKKMFDSHDFSYAGPAFKAVSFREGYELWNVVMDPEAGRFKATAYNTGAKDVQLKLSLLTEKRSAQGNPERIVAIQQGLATLGERKNILDSTMISMQVELAGVEQSMKALQDEAISMRDHTEGRLKSVKEQLALGEIELSKLREILPGLERGWAATRQDFEADRAVFQKIYEIAAALEMGKKSRLIEVFLEDWRRLLTIVPTLVSVVESVVSVAGPFHGEAVGGGGGGGGGVDAAPGER
jgi:hypothetical protein